MGRPRRLFNCELQGITCPVIDTSCDDNYWWSYWENCECQFYKSSSHYDKERNVHVIDDTCKRAIWRDTND